MTDAVKIAAVGIICAVLCLLVRNLRPELEPFVQISGIIVLAVILFEYLGTLLENASELLDEFDVINSAYLEVIVKVLAIAVITQTGADICSDSGNSALASAVGLAGKVMILILSFSLIKAVASLAGGLLG